MELSLYLSDHDTAQILEFPENFKKIEQYWYIQKQDLSNENIEFKYYLSQLSWQEVYKESNVNKAFNNFHQQLILFYKLCFPFNKIKMTSNLQSPKWMTKGLRKSSAIGRSLRFSYYRHKTKEAHNKYNNYEKPLKNELYGQRRT